MLVVMKACGVLLMALLLVGGPHVVADEWPAPAVQTVFSPNGQYFVRIVPRTTRNLPVAESQKAERARGEFYARARDRSYRLVADVTLQNPVSPAYAKVTDSGHLVTFDDWFTMGFANVIVFYRPNGELIRRLAIEDLYAPEKLNEVPRSVSSRQWRCGVWYTPSSGSGGETLSVLDHFGGSFLLDVRTGRFEYRQGAGKCQAGTPVVF